MACAIDLFVKFDIMDIVFKDDKIMAKNYLLIYSEQLATENVDFKLQNTEGKHQMKNTMQFTVREAGVADAEAIQKLNRIEMGYDFPVDKTIAALCKILGKDSDKIFVAVIDDKVVGYIHANDYELLYQPSMKNIMGIAVDSEYRNKGIGKALLNSVEEWARQSGAVGVRLVSGMTRIDAHKFYRRCGYDNANNQLNFKKIF